MFVLTVSERSSPLCRLKTKTSLASHATCPKGGEACRGRSNEPRTVQPRVKGREVPCRLGFTPVTLRRAGFRSFASSLSSGSLRSPFKGKVGCKGGLGEGIGTNVIQLRNHPYSVSF